MDGWIDLRIDVCMYVWMDRRKDAIMMLMTLLVLYHFFSAAEVIPVIIYPLTPHLRESHIL